MQHDLIRVYSGIISAELHGTYFQVTVALAASPRRAERAASKALDW